MTALFALALAAAVIGGVPSQPLERLWILPFENQRSDAELAHLEHTLPALLATYVSRSREYAVVDRDDLDRVLAEQSLSLAGLADDDARRGVGGSLGATLIVSGSFRRDGPVLRAAARVVDVASGQVLASAEGEGSEQDLGRLASSLYAEVQRELRARLPEPPPEHLDRAPVSNLHFMKGLGHYFAARYERALAEFLAGAETTDVFRWWRAKCHLARGRYDQAYLELVQIEDDGGGRIDREELERARRDCRKHLNPDEMGMIRDLTADPR
jgi:TolB-like protein